MLHACLAILLFISMPAMVFAAPQADKPPLTPFQEYNPDINKYDFAKSFITSLEYYSRLKKRLDAEQAIGDKYDEDLPTIQTFVDNRTLDNTELRVARNYLSRYASSKNMLIRRVAYDAMMAYERNLLVSSRERQLWKVYYRFKKAGIPRDLSLVEFRKQLESLARDRKSAGIALLEAVIMLQKVILSAASCADENCMDLVLTQIQRDKLLEKLNVFAGDNMVWGIKSGQGTFEAAVASLREVLEDPVYVSAASRK